MGDGPAEEGRAVLADRDDARGSVAQLRRAALLLALVAAGCGGGARDAVTADVFDGGATFRNRNGAWTIPTRCAAHAGPGYVARAVRRRDGVAVLDERRRRDGVDVIGEGGIGEFDWQAARRRGRSFDHGFAWPVLGRACARANGGVGVAYAHIVDEPRVEDGVGRLTVDVFFKDNHVAPRDPLVRVRYRYRVTPTRVHVAIDVTELCSAGRCGWQGRAFVKEPKLAARVDGGGYESIVVLDAGGRVARNRIEHTGEPCMWRGTDARRQTLQCDDDERAVVRFAGRGVPALNVRMTAVGAPWESGRGFDGWALASGSRPRYAARDSALDGVRWGCKAATPASPLLRRWEVGGGTKDARGRYRAAAAIFPAWEGGRGFDDCEPNSRLFGPRGETWTVLATYWFGR